MTEVLEGSQSDRELGKSFMRLLVEDAIAARDRRLQSDTAFHRREEIRATFAAIEGATWIYREEVRDAARAVGVLTPLADLALRERSFSVTEKGDIVEQIRFVTLPTVIRLTTKQARLVAPSIAMDLSDEGWANLKLSIEVRNRVTHPKSVTDFIINEGDLAAIHGGLMWLLRLVDHASHKLLAAQRDYYRLAREVVADLKAGDPQAWNDYLGASSDKSDED